MAEIKARPTTYKGIKMRSRLEAGYAAWLDEMGMEWEYEPCAFAGELGQYLPDFYIPSLRVSWQHEPVPAYIEVKPNAEAVTPDLAVRMAVIHESNLDAELLVQTPQRLYALCYLAPDIGPVFRKDLIWVLGAVKDGVEGQPRGPADVEWMAAIPSPDFHQPWHGEWWGGRLASHP